MDEKNHVRKEVKLISDDFSLFSKKYIALYEEYNKYVFNISKQRKHYPDLSITI